jgi:hypothetical protein
MKNGGKEAESSVEESMVEGQKGGAPISNQQSEGGTACRAASAVRLKL